MHSLPFSESISIIVVPLPPPTIPPPSTLLLSPVPSLPLPFLPFTPLVSVLYAVTLLCSPVPPVRGFSHLCSFSACPAFLPTFTGMGAFFPSHPQFLLILTFLPVLHSTPTCVITPSSRPPSPSNPPSACTLAFPRELVSIRLGHLVCRDSSRGGLGKRDRV